MNPKRPIHFEDMKVSKFGGFYCTKKANGAYCTYKANENGTVYENKPKQPQAQSKFENKANTSLDTQVVLQAILEAKEEIIKACAPR